MGEMTSLVSLHGHAAARHDTVYSQRMLPEAPALLALVHAHGAPRGKPLNLRGKALPRSSCLRKMSAYNGGFRVGEDEGEAPHAEPVYERAAARFAKKRLSFADQHGGQLVLEREFHERDAPIFCNKAITYSLPSSAAMAQYHSEQLGSWGGGSVIQRLLRGAVGGRGSEQQKSGWSQPELISLCVLSCSVVGCAVFTYARHLQTK